MRLYLILETTVTQVVLGGLIQWSCFSPTLEALKVAGNKELELVPSGKGAEMF